MNFYDDLPAPTVVRKQQKRKRITTVASVDSIPHDLKKDKIETIDECCDRLTEGLLLDNSKVFLASVHEILNLMNTDDKSLNQDQSLLTSDMYLSIVSPCFHILLCDLCRFDESQVGRAAVTVVNDNVASKLKRIHRRKNISTLVDGYEALCLKAESVSVNSQQVLSCGCTLFKYVVNSWRLIVTDRLRILACTDNFDFRKELQSMRQSRIDSLRQDFAELDGSVSSTAGGSTVDTISSAHISFGNYTRKQCLLLALMWRVEALTAVLSEIYTKFYNLFSWSRTAIEDAIDALTSYRAFILAEVAKFPLLLPPPTEIDTTSEGTSEALRNNSSDSNSSSNSSSIISSGNSSSQDMSGSILHPAESVGSGLSIMCLFNSEYYIPIEHSPLQCIERLDLLINTVSTAKHKQAAGTFSNNVSTAGCGSVSQLSTNKIRSENSTAHPMRSKNTDIVR